MTFGTITAFNEKKGIGFVQRTHGDRIPFSLRDVEDGVPAAGAPVSYSVVGGKVGVFARRLRVHDQ